MHFSAKRGKNAVKNCACRLSVRPSVCPSVTLVNCDHIGWNSSEIISQSVSLGRSLFATPTWRVCSPKFWPKVTHPPVDLSVGDIRSQIAAEWSKIAQRSQWRAYRKPPSLFLMVPSLTPYDLPFPQKGVPYAPTYANRHISAMGDPIHFMFGSRVGFSGTALFTVRTNPRWRPPPCWKNFKWRYLRNRSSDPLHFYPRDAMLARVIAIATCPSVCPSRAGVVSKRRKLAAWFLHHLVAPRL